MAKGNVSGPLRCYGFFLLLLVLPSTAAAQTYSFSKLDLSQAVSANVMGVSFADYDGDNLMDLYLAVQHGPNRLLRNNGDLIFTDVAPELGLDDDAYGRVGIWADVNNDGLVDLFLANSNSCKIFHNTGSGFEEKTSSAGLLLNGITNGVLWRDVNSDGLIDFYSANFRADNSLFLNNGDGSFTDLVRSYGVNDPNEFAMGGAFGDYDNDGDPDLYLVHDGYQRFVLYNNSGHGSFRDVSSEAGVNYRGMGMGTVFADFDNDGFLDLYITNLDSNTIYFNNGDGTFTNTTRYSQIGDVGMGWGVVALDYDNDGLLDIYVVNTSGFHSPKMDNVLYRNLGGRRFDIVTASASISSLLDGYAAAAADINNDGYQDLVVSNLNSEGFEVFVNNGGENNYLKVELAGTVSNRYAIGARARIVANETQQMRELSGGSGYLSQDSPILHFGLGKAAIVDTLEIFWPSGTIDRYYDLAANQTLHFQETTTTAVKLEVENIPSAIRLYQNYPNPFNPETTIEFEISLADSWVRLSVYDLEGREIAVIADRKYSPGRYKSKWDGKNYAGVDVSSGVYLMRLRTAGRQLLRKVTLLR